VAGFPRRSIGIIEKLGVLRRFERGELGAEAEVSRADAATECERSRSSTSLSGSTPTNLALKALAAAGGVVAM